MCGMLCLCMSVCMCVCVCQSRPSRRPSLAFGSTPIYAEIGPQAEGYLQTLMQPNNGIQATADQYIPVTQWYFYFYFYFFYFFRFVFWVCNLYFL